MEKGREGIKELGNEKKVLIWVKKKWKRYGRKRIKKWLDRKELDLRSCENKMGEEEEKLMENRNKNN